MAVKSKAASLVYKLVLVVVCLVGVLMNTGLLSGNFAPYRLLYYTIFSNLICLVFYIASAIFTGVDMKKSEASGPVRFAPHFKGAIVMAMVMTGVAYFTLLTDAPFSAVSPFALAANMIAHVVVPLMVLLDWILFDRKGQFAGVDPVVWAVVPLAYYCAVLVAVQLGLKFYGGASYPYPFINPDQIQWGPVLRNVVIFAAVYVVAGYLLLVVDKLLGRQAKKRQQEAAELATNRAVYKAGSANRAATAEAPDTTVDGSTVPMAPAGTPAAPVAPVAPGAAPAPAAAAAPQPPAEPTPPKPE